MNILCATDNNYAQHCYIMLLSLFDNNASNQIDAYILVSNLSNENEAILKNLPTKALHKVHLIEVEDKLENCPIREGDHVSIVTYYRILAPTLLPNTIDKILYLDVDMIVCKDISDLYNSNIDGYAIGAILDSDYYSAIDKYERLLYPSSLKYINAGVLLINLAYWRDNKIMDECLEFIRKYPERCLFHDQDTINYVLRDRKQLLPLKYNFQTGFIRTDSIVEAQIKQEVYKVIQEKSYAIIHYTFDKPWNANFNPYRGYYLHYKKLSPYAKVPVPKQSTIWHLKRWTYNICAFIGLVKPISTYIVKNDKLKFNN